MKTKYIAMLSIDIILILLYIYYQPLCEPCISKEDCPPCISDEQYFLLGLGILLNIGFLLYIITNKRFSKTLNKKEPKPPLHKMF
jgi:hypothetical protein